MEVSGQPLALAALLPVQDPHDNPWNEGWVGLSIWMCWRREKPCPFYNSDSWLPSLKPSHNELSCQHSGKLKKPVKVICTALLVCFPGKLGQFYLFVKEFSVSMQVVWRKMAYKKGFGFHPVMYCRKRWRITEISHMTPWFPSLCRVCPWVCNSVVTVLFPCHGCKIISCRFHRCTNFSCMACNCVSRESHNLASWHGILFWNICMM